MIRNGIDWEGMALHDRSRYQKFRRVLEDELEEKIYISTRKLMRHQDNWFKKSDKRIKWINFENSFHEADIIISEWLKN